MYGGSNRWWESYLVRYFMPSIAGMIIVLWLSVVAGKEFRDILLLPQSIDGFSTSNVILLILYGNLFCYVSSYPVLVFHVTRVIDLGEEDRRKHCGIGGYSWTLFASVLAISLAMCSGGYYSVAASYILVVVFSSIQLTRLWIGMNKMSNYEGLNEPASMIFAYSHSLSRRRSKKEQVKERVSQGEKIKDTTYWRTDFIDTYKHMREHGNSAFIFYLELMLAALIYTLVDCKELTAIQKLSYTGVLLAIWGIPSIFVHYLGQHIEYRFSHYSRRSK